MGWLLTGLVLWIVFSYAFAALAPVILEAAAYAIAWLFLAFWITLKTILGIIVKAAFAALLLCSRGLMNAALFLRLFIEELRHDSGADNAEEAPADDSSQEGGAADAYAAALSLLGLPQDFTRESLSRAYKQVIRRVHPDAPGGSTQAAQAVNAARDLLMQSHGWT